MYRHYIFDLYGTLADIRTDEEDPRVWRSLAEHAGASVSADLKDVYAFLCRETEKQKSGELAALGIQGPAEIDMLKVWERLFPAADPRQVSRLFRRLTTRKLALYPGARQVLQALRKRGHTVTLLSNAQESFTLPELKQLGLEACFDHIFLSSRYGVRKPSPAFFGLLRQAGMEPADCLMIGNDDACDCRGAAEAGMDSLYIRTEQSPPLSGPLPRNCRQIASLWDVLEREP
ncbi:MAG: HAD family hydrolase [Clostridia bacterium]|nr:HAD family hydrolase [Clostridia bacterium]